ncbi:Protein LIPS-15 [Aphelenchoides avenae]|nr:Protein LIPS-15 [Aphelenchus avenae]
MLGTFAFVCLLAVAEATFSQNFRSFLTTTFGAEVEKNLSRTDLGEWGSFGGGEHTAGVRTGKIAVIFVHDMPGWAESMKGNRDYLLGTYQYSDPEIYATSYGNRSWGSLRCEYIKHVRQLIVAVYQFSGSQRVNVIANAHGVPITRKVSRQGVFRNGDTTFL